MAPQEHKHGWDQLVRKVREAVGDLAAEMFQSLTEVLQARMLEQKEVHRQHPARVMLAASLAAYDLYHSFIKTWDDEEWLRRQLEGLGKEDEPS